jgi:CRP-like cAMP-binding protein
MSEPAISETILARLQSLPIFRTLSAEQTAAIAALMSHRKAQTGETLVAEGENGDEMFILLRGQVRITKRTLDDERYVVAERDEHDTPCFGELALLDEDRRSATIEVTQESELLVLRRAQFERFGLEQPGAGLLVTRELARRVCGYLRRSNRDTLLLFEALVNEVRSKTAG